MSSSTAKKISFDLVEPNKGYKKNSGRYGITKNGIYFLRRLKFCLLLRIEVSYKEMF